MPLEELIVRHAFGEDVSGVRRRAAAGVMMIPVPRAGITRLFVVWSVRRRWWTK